jgi:4-hydroxyphenylpyruvate dioxygenase-like putative hemolysin
VRFIPFVNQYRIPVQIAGILLLTLGVYFEGGYTTEMAWRERVREVEAKLQVAEKQSAEVNTEIVTKIVTQTKLVTQRGDDIIRYVDREVVRDQEVIRFVENCPVPEIIVNTHNAAALNRPIEEKK